METIMIRSVELSLCHGNSAGVKDGLTVTQNHYYYLLFFLVLNVLGC